MITNKQKRKLSKRRRRALVKALGGFCAFCGKRRRKLEFNHKDPTTRTWVANKKNCLTRIKLYERDAAKGLIELACVKCHPRGTNAYANVIIPN